MYRGQSYSIIPLSVEISGRGTFFICKRLKVIALLSTYYILVRCLLNVGRLLRSRRGICFWGVCFNGSGLLIGFAGDWSEGFFSTALSLPLTEAESAVEVAVESDFVLDVFIGI